MRSPYPVGSYVRAVGDWLVHWADRAPDRTFLAERAADGKWRRLGYRDALSDVRRVGQALLNLGLDASKPVVILSDNSLHHALLALGAMHVGVPVAPISPAYSLMSKDFGKLKYIMELLKPGLVYAIDERFGPAIAATAPNSAKLAFSGKPTAGVEAISFSEFLETNPGSTLEREFAKLRPESTAKILFTSGSTGMPKGVINTHRMLCSNQQMYGQLWQFLEDTPPVLVDWLPWNHTFGSNNNFGMVMRNGGTLYIDGGKPAPGLIETSVKNLREIPSTIYFNVPRGFDLLMPYLESDAELRKTFFRDLEVVCYAGAALPQNLWERLEKLAIAERGEKLAMISAWGSTETSPGVTAVHWPIDRAGVIGLPAPGCELKLVPSGGKLEARIRGLNITPGYFGREDLTRAAFDEEGFYKIGDALKFADPDDPLKGLVFDGRVVEDFKLSTGTWVSVGTIRVRLIAACDPLLQDAVITGHDLDEIGALVFLKPGVNDDSSTRSRIASALKALKAESSGSSTYPARVLIMAEPPQIDANEITDKGYINQRAVLERRAAEVQRLYSSSSDVITSKV